MDKYYWNDGTINSEDDFKLKYAYGGLTKAQWREYYGIVPNEIDPLMDKVISDVSSLRSEFDSIASVVASNDGLNTLKEMLDEVYIALRGTHELSWFKKYEESHDRAYLPWGDHQAQFGRYDLYWHAMPDVVIYNLAAFVRHFRHGGATYAEWKAAGVIPDSYTVELNKILNITVTYAGLDAYHTGKLHEFLAASANPQQLQVMLTDYYNENNWEVARNFTKEYGCYNFHLFTDAQLQAVQATANGETIPDTPTYTLEPYVKPGSDDNDDVDSSDKTDSGAQDADVPDGAVNSSGAAISDNTVVDDDDTGANDSDGANNNANVDDSAAANVAEAVNNTSPTSRTNSSKKGKNVGTLLLFGGIAAAIYALGKD